MKRLAAIVGLLALFVIAFAPRAARAEVWVRNYEVDVTPRGDSAHFRVTIAYGVGPAERKDDGFKFIGKKPPQNLEFHDLTGQHVSGSVAAEPSSGEWKLTFQLGSDRTVVIDFDQALEVDAGGWGGTSASVSWAPNFKLRVEKSRYAVHGVSGGDGLTCSGAAAASSCWIDAGSPGDLRFTLAEANLASHAVDIALTVIGLIFGIGMVLLSIRAKRAVALSTRGVVPPVPEVAYPEGTYRAPPPIVKQGATPDPVLTSEDAAELRTLLWTRVAVVVAATVVAGFAKLPLRVGIVEIIVALVAGGFAVASLSVKRGGGVFLAIPLVAAFALLIGPIVAAVVTFFALIVGAIAAAPPGAPGTGSTTSGTSSFWTSSTTSSSSCGGGGGSSCGGGGGGCGGGGGGGGCGG